MSGIQSMIKKNIIDPASYEDIGKGVKAAFAVVTEDDEFDLDDEEINKDVVLVYSAMLSTLREAERMEALRCQK